MFTYKLQPVPESEGGPGGRAFSLTADSRDVLRWERGQSTRSLARLLAEPNIADSYYLAYLAAKRTGKVADDCTLAEFEARYLLLLGQLSQAVAAPDPTRPAR